MWRSAGRWEASGASRPAAAACQPRTLTQRRRLWMLGPPRLCHQDQRLPFRWVLSRIVKFDRIYSEIEYASDIWILNTKYICEHRMVLFGPKYSNKAIVWKIQKLFQALNSRFNSVLAELRQVHLRTMKPASLPPMENIKTDNSIVKKERWRNYFIEVENLGLTQFFFCRGIWVGLDSKANGSLVFDKPPNLPDVFLS